MIRRGTRIAAVALAAAAISPPLASADPLGEAERLAAAAEARLVEVERLGADGEPAAARARRLLEHGEAQHRLGDWRHAALLLSDAVDDPASQGDARRAEALFLLADALRRQGDCGAARVRYDEVLALGDGARRAEAVSGALECAVKGRRADEAERLLAEAERTFGDDAPPAVRYLAAKAAFERTDLAAPERLDRAAELFERVGAPFELQAGYFRGVVEIERQDLHGSLRWFEACARAEPGDERQRQVRELCLLALGRVHAQMGDAPAALDWYAAVPWDSPRFGEALYEIAWTHVKARQYEQALRTATFIADLAPGSPLAPEATVLVGHLLLRLGRYAEATDAYNHVINSYAPVRDELDAVLAMREDPVRYFHELIGREGEALDAAAVLPPVAVRWASSSPEVAAALQLVGSLDAARRDLQAARDAAERVEALLARGGGLDAFPRLRRGAAIAHAVENDAAAIEGDLVTALSAAAWPALPAGARAALERASAARAALEARLRALPRTQEAVDARLARMRERLERVDREAYRTGYLVDHLAASVSGTERFVEEQRAEIDADPEGRRELAEELRKHRAVVDGYAEELRALRQELARARDAAGGADALAEEARLRAGYQAALDAEREAAEAARASVAPAARALFEREAALRGRLAALRARADALRVGLQAEASRRAAELRAQASAERAALAGHLAALDGVQGDAKELVGRIALRSLRDVRDQFYALVLKADVGVVDVAWSRKRVRLEKIQQLSIEKAREIEQLDREYRAMLREVE